MKTPKPHIINAQIREYGQKKTIPIFSIFSRFDQSSARYRFKIKSVFKGWLILNRSRADDWSNRKVFRGKTKKKWNHLATILTENDIYIWSYTFADNPVLFNNFSVLFNNFLFYSTTFRGIFPHPLSLSLRRRHENRRWRLCRIFDERLKRSFNRVIFSW